MTLNNNSKMLLGVAAGMAAGYLLGTMFAPKKGTDFRQGILDSLTDLNDNVSDLIEEGRERLSELAGMGGTAENYESGSGFSGRNSL